MPLITHLHLQHPFASTPLIILLSLLSLIYRTSITQVEFFPYYIIVIYWKIELFILLHKKMEQIDECDDQGCVSGDGALDFEYYLLVLQVASVIHWIISFECAVWIPISISDGMSFS